MLHYRLPTRAHEPRYKICLKIKTYVSFINLIINLYYFEFKFEYLIVDVGYELSVDFKIHLMRAISTSKQSVISRVHRFDFQHLGTQIIYHLLIIPLLSICLGGFNSPLFSICTPQSIPVATSPASPSHFPTFSIWPSWPPPRKASTSSKVHPNTCSSISCLQSTITLHSLSGLHGRNILQG